MGQWDWATYIIFIIVLLVSLPWLIHIDKFKSSKYDKYNLILAILPTFLLLAMRGDSVGIDLIRYERSIEYTKILNTISIKLFSEPLLNLIYWVSNKLGGLHIFLIITAGIECSFVGIALAELHKRGKKITLLYYIFWGLIVIRSFSMVSNAIAISASLCAYIYLSDESVQGRRKYWIYALIAFLFHNSAIINIVVYFCCRSVRNSGKRNKKKELLFKSFVIISFILGIYFLSKGVFNNFIASMGSGEYGRLQVESTFGIGNVLVRLPFFMLVIFSLQKIHKRNGTTSDPYVWLLIVDIIVAQMKYMNQDFERFTMYTGLSIAFLCPELYEVYKNKFKGIIKIITPFIVLIYITYYLYLWAIKSNYGIMPYRLWG